MNEAHLAAEPPDRFPADPSGKTARSFCPEGRTAPRLRPDRSVRIMANARFVVRPPGRAAHSVHGDLLRSHSAGKYSVEFRFSVRSARELVADEDNLALMIKAGKPGIPEIGRLPYMAADYLRSRNVVRELDSAGK